MPNALILTLFTVIGGFIGAFIKHLLDMRTNAENARRARKLELYTSFIEIFWRLTEQYQKSQAREDSYEYSKLANEIALYGSDEVVRCLAPVIRRSGNGEETVTKLIIAMRRDILGQPSLSLFEPVRTIIFERGEPLSPGDLAR